MAFGGEWRLCVRRCISPPVMTSMPASSWSSTAAWVARYCASAMDAIESWPTATSRSSASYQSGTLCAPMTVVEYFAYFVPLFVIKLYMKRRALTVRRQPIIGRGERHLSKEELPLLRCNSMINLCGLMTGPVRTWIKVEHESARLPAI